MLPRLRPHAAPLGYAKARQLLVVAGLCTGLLLAVAMSWYAFTSRQAVIDDAVREMRNDALMLAEDQDRLLQAADDVQRGLIMHLRASGVDSPEQLAAFVSPATHQNMLDRIAGLPYVNALLLFDQRGQLLNYSPAARLAPAMHAAGTDVIRDVASAGAGQAFVSAPSRGKISGQWEVFLSRPFIAANGQQIGYVASTIDLAYFQQVYARLPLTGGGAFALYRRDGTLLARYPPADPLIGKRFGDTANFARLLGALEGGVVRQTGRFDGQDRLIAPHSMAHFPLIVAVSDTMPSVMRAWREDIRLLVGTTALLELAIVGGLLLLLRHLRGEERLRAVEAAHARAAADLARAEEQAHATDALQTQQQRFDTAAQNMVQALLMVDQAGSVVLVNRRFHELSGLPADSVTAGMPYGVLTAFVVAHGNIVADDMAVLTRQRHAAVQANQRTSFLWELSDGRAFMVTHQPMETGWLTTYEDTTEQRRSEARIVHLAQYDALTDLPNRVLFREKLELALAFAQRGHLLALLCLDLDQFKAVNDTLGHPLGDRLLQAVALRLQQGLRATDTIARLGGDEFAVVQSMLNSPHEATDLAGRLITLIEAPFDIDGHQIVIGASIGIAFAPTDALDPDVLLKDADLALYRAKLDGRGMFRLFHAAMDAEMQARRLLELDLRQALRCGQFELFYQPLIDLHTDAVGGFEALLRWHHPQRGMISPAKFIPLAEEIGAIVPIGEWVLREACRAAAAWPQALKVAVNLSPVQFKCRELVATIVAALRNSGLAPSRLELEITETVMLQDTTATLATLHALHAIGVRIAMDDFGTGYSSLSYLRRFPFDRIKIDQSFVRELGHHSDCGAIIRAVIGLSHELGIATTAEGVETPEQLVALAQAGCSDIQGYLFSPPVPLDEVPAVLRRMPTPADLLKKAAVAEAETVA